jgi:hypothetical protein
MKTLFQNEACIILYDDYTWQPDRSESTRVTSYLGYDTLLYAHEIWVYRSATKRFYAYKNRGLINEAICRMLDCGIKLKSFGASINTGNTTELCFATSKDQFHFELKF